MNVKRVLLSIVTIVISSLLLNQSVSAGLVPGTIQKGDAVSDIQQCKKENGITYNTGFSCSAKTCTSYNNDSTCNTSIDTTVNICTSDVKYYEGDDGYAECGRNSSNLGTETITTCTVYNNDATCNTWTDSSPTFTTSTYYDYNYNSSSYTFGGKFNPGSNRILGDDAGKTCFISADGTNKTKPINLRLSTCDINNTTYYSIPGSNGACTTYSSNNTFLDTYDQLGNTSFINNLGTIGSKTCVIQGRYAEVDDTGPVISTINGGSFGNDSSQWCNLDKYNATGIFLGKPYGSIGNINTPGCDYYDNTNGQNIIDNFNFSVQDAESGLSEIKVEFGTCAGIYTFDPTLSELINSTSSSSGVKSSFLAPVTIYSNNSSTYAGKEIISLEALFGKPLNECLSEGENYIKISANDMARDNADGTTLKSNSSIFSPYDEITKIGDAIRIDNSGPTFTATGNYNTNTWYNESITGVFNITDQVNSGEILCTTYTKKATQGQCDNSILPNGAIWNVPVSSTGAYDIYQCEGIDITNNSICQYTTVPVTYSWLHGIYTSVNLTTELKTVECIDSLGITRDTSNCNESDIILAGNESIILRDSISYTLQRITPLGCFTLGTSTIGGTDTLCP